MNHELNIDKNLQGIANVEAQVWEDSPYYDHAENWTWLFWSEDHHFLRLFKQLDLTNVLELACGHGRHAEYMLENYGAKVNHLVMMDILQSNIDFCISRMKKFDGVSYVVNDGAEFQSVDDSSLTAIYCYDAMVHFNHEVVESYLKDAHRALAIGGKVLFHHSNNSTYNNKHFGMNPHARAYMPEGLFKKYAEQAGLRLIEQVIIPWGDIEALDCISLLEKVA
jgi:ubiquinone/menaquinone biosynthesis C-methylase UbiE